MPTAPRRSPEIANRDVAHVLRELALLLEIDGVPFKPRAYEKAALAVSGLSRPVSDIHRESGVEGLDAIPNVGAGIAARIAELLTTGRISDLDALRAKYPVDALGLSAIEGMGPKTIRLVWERLGVRSVADLERAAERGQLHELERFGEKRERKLLTAIVVHEALGGRFPLATALGLSATIERRLRRVRGLRELAVAGSLRRRKETIGDLDVLVASDHPEQVAAAFVSMPEVAAVLGHGPTKSMVRLSNGIHADLRVVPEESFGAALQYFTGSKAHNVALRRIAQKRGLKLSEYGLFSGTRRIAGRSEEQVYRALGLPFIPPELRENAGEIEAAFAGTLPELIAPGSLRGDLHVHTSWTGGRHGLTQMAEAAQRAGLQYVAFTDRAGDAATSRTLDETRLREQVREIRALERRLGSVRLLAGAEVEVRPDGSLGLADAVLAELDWVGAAVHTRLDLPRAQMTRRIVRALEHPLVDALFHPMGRVVGRGPAIDADFDAVIAAARRSGTALEIDAQPERLDLGSELVRKAVQAGVTLVIGSGARAADELRFAEDYGTFVARRGWATAGDVLNTLGASELSTRLEQRAQRRRAG